MNVRTVLVCLTTPHNAATLLDAAAIIARRYNAHLIGLHTVEALVVYPGIAMHVPDEAFATFNANQKRQAGAIKAIFDERTRGTWSAKCEWRLLQAKSRSAADRIVETARAADLVIMAQEDVVHDRPDQHHLQARVIRESGRPVLVIPPGFDGDTLGENVLLGWSATREATRAAHDLLSVIDIGSRIRILRIGEHLADELADFTANDLAGSIARHGHKVEVAHREKFAEKNAEVLNSQAFEMGADMIATGAFGHSRLYDFVIGAVTRELLRDAKLPVLYSK